MDILGWLSSEIADTFASTEEDDFVNGDGNGKPKGFMAYTRAATSDKTRAFGTIEKNGSGKWNRHYSGRTDRHSLQAESEIPQKMPSG